MVKKQDTLTKRELSALIKARTPEYKIKDIDAILEALEEVILYAIDTGQKVKFLKSFTLTPVIRPARRHYSGVGAVGGKGKYIEIPKRMRVKYKSLQRIKELENEKIK